MLLFINTVSSPACFILADTKRQIKHTQSYNIKGNESSLFIELLDDFLKQNNYGYGSLENIIVVNGPGSFTGLRTIVLAVNTIAFIKGVSITPLSYFDLFTEFPVVKASSKRDCFVKYSAEAQVKVETNEKLIEKLDKAYGQADIKGLETLENINYPAIIKTIKLEDNKRISPLYIKKPNIS